MKRTFTAQNITCNSCANTIKVTLEDDFGNVEVNLGANPKEVSIEINDEKELEHFKDEMQGIGFPVIEEIKG
jgi:copper chaperone CopZ